MKNSLFIHIIIIQYLDVFIVLIICLKWVWNNEPMFIIICTDDNLNRIWMNALFSFTFDVRWFLYSFFHMNLNLTLNDTYTRRSVQFTNGDTSHYFFLKWCIIREAGRKTLDGDCHSKHTLFAYLTKNHNSAQLYF